MASITLPDGVSAEVTGESLYHFCIEREDLKISFFEHQGDLDSALALAKKAFSILPSEEPVICMSPPEIEFDATRIEIYGKNENNQYRQLHGKNQGPYSWIFSLQGEEGVLERRGSQIMALFHSLKAPEQRKIDLSSMKMESMRTKTVELDSFIHEAMEKAQVPGLSLAIIERGEIVYSQGFGKTVLSKEGKSVLPSTRFMIGSISKSMTTFLIAKLEEEGLLHWNDRAVELYPNFRLGDEELSNKLTLEDLVCASTGIPRRDWPMIMNHTSKKAENLFADLLHLKPSSESNEVFQYNNQLVAASGFIAAKRAQANLSMDEGFASLLKSRLFIPMEMTRSTVEFEEVVHGEDFAYPHNKAFDGTTVPVDLDHERFVTHVAPAGAVWSTASDMANYAITELNGGLFRSKRILSEERLVYRRRGKVAHDHESKYALGWLVGKKRGLDVVQHNGATCGFSSNLVLFPTTQSGIVILSNSYGGLILEPIVEKILSLWFNVDLQEKKLLTSNCATFDSYWDFFQRHTFDLPNDVVKRALGGHFHPEIGYFEICNGEDGKPYLSKEGVRYGLAGFREDGGKEKFMVIDSPFIGFMLEPIFAEGISLRIQRGQESYECMSS
jgi:CubicO group peptidase (beta-lactamase class C family)